MTANAIRMSLLVATLTATSFGSARAQSFQVGLVILPQAKPTASHSTKIREKIPAASSRREHVAQGPRRSRIAINNDRLLAGAVSY